MKKQTLLLLLGLLCAWLKSPLFAQNSSPGLVYDASVSPSPGAASALGTPTSVNMSTGTMSVGIPLASIQGHQMQLPVSLAYQATGIKLKQLIGPVGTGWSLQASGVISRVVRGKPDDDYSGRIGGKDSGYSGANGKFKGSGYTVESFIVSNTYANTEEKKLLDGTWDSEPDLYYFNFLGRSGQFVLDKDGKAVLLPQQDLTIDRIIPKYYNDNDKAFNDQKWATWVITTADGRSYYFGNSNPNYMPQSSNKDIQGVELTEYTTTTPSLSKCIPSRTTTVGPFASSWYLTRIAAPNGETEFTFRYKTGESVAYRDVMQLRYELLWTVKRNWPNCSYPVAGDDQPSAIVPLSTTTRITNPLYLEQIKSGHGNGEILFNYNSREVSTQQEGGMSLEGIEVRDGLNERARKSIRFTYGYFSTNLRPTIQRLRLDQVQIGAEPPYAFRYNSDSLSSRYSASVDFWGYRNNGSESIAIPQVEYIPQEANHSRRVYAGADRQANAVAMQAAILTGITYPTGGSVEYTYGAHQYWNSSSGRNEIMGGLRIERITVKDGSGMSPPMVTNYAYTLDSDPSRSSGTADLTLTQDQLYYKVVKVVQKRKIGGNLAAHFLARSSTPVNTSFTANGSPIIYSQVSVSQTGKGRTVYSYTSFNDHPDQAPFEFVILDSGQREEQDQSKPPHTPNRSRAWERGLLTDVVVYSESGQRKRFQHLDYAFNVPTYNYPPYYLDHPPIYGLIFFRQEVINTGSNGFSLASDHYGYYLEESQWVNLTKQTERVYDQSDESKWLETTTEYSYNPKNLQVSTVKKTDSEGRTLLTKYRYACDYVDISLPLPDQELGKDLQSPINEMVRRHMSNAVIETQVWQETPTRKLLSAALTVYDYIPKTTGFGFWRYTGDWEPYYPELTLKHSMIVPKEVLQVATLDGLTSYTETDLDAYGKLRYPVNLFQSEAKTIAHNEQGGVTEAEGRDGVPITTLWNRSGSRPIASVSNARVTEVAYASFEGDGDQGWTYPEVYTRPVFESQAKTGTGCYLLYSEADNVITKSGLAADQTYFVSFWASNTSGTLLVNETPVTVTEQKGFYRLKVTGTTSVTIRYQSGGGSIYLDELRLHPVGSQMTTQTYDPLYGVTSQTDPNSRSTYYQYDALGRIIAVKDNEQNLVKDYVYHTIGQ
jgi:YD repeat-containing protein